MSSEFQQLVHLLELNIGENRDDSLQPRFSSEALQRKQECFKVQLQLKR